MVVVKLISVINFVAGENDDGDDNDDEEDDEAGAAPGPVLKKSRLESDFEELFGEHFESGKREGCSTPAEEIRDYFAIPHIPTMENPLKRWDRNHS